MRDRSQSGRRRPDGRPPGQGQGHHGLDDIGDRGELAAGPVANHRRVGTMALDFDYVPMT